MSSRAPRAENARVGSARHAISVDLADGIQAVPREQWGALLTDEDSPFIAWDWLDALESSASAAPKSGWTPCHLLVRRRPGDELLAACPLYLKSHSFGEFVFDHAWAEAAQRAGIRYFPKLLAAVPFTPHTGRRFLTRPGELRPALLESLAGALASLCTDNRLSSVHVNFCMEDEARALERAGFLVRTGYQYHWQNRGFAGFDDYLAALKSRRRSAVRHERAALRDQGVTIRVLSGEEISPTLAPSMFRLYLSTIRKLYWGRQYLNRAFFERIITGWRPYLRLMLAFRDERLIAGTLNLEKAGVFYGRYWGCFEELKFLHFNVCYYAAIEHCIARGLQRFEPGAGGEYKWLRGFDPALTRSAHFIAHEGLRAGVARFLEAERHEIEDWIATGQERSQLKSAPQPSDAEPG